MGNNEVVGPYGPGCAYLSRDAAALGHPTERLRQVHQDGAADHRLPGPTRQARPAAGRVGRHGDVREQRRRAGDDPRLAAVYRNFEANLRDIVRDGGGRGGADAALHGRLEHQRLRPLSLASPAGARRAGAWCVGAVIQPGADRVADRRRGAGPRRPLEALRIDPQYADTAFMLGLPRPRGGGHRGRQAPPRRRRALGRPALPARSPDQRDHPGGGPGAAPASASLRRRGDADGLRSRRRPPRPPAGSSSSSMSISTGTETTCSPARWPRRSDGALFGAETGGLPWLDPQGCAAALAYTAHERFSVLQKVEPDRPEPAFHEPADLLRGRGDAGPRARPRKGRPRGSRRAEARERGRQGRGRQGSGTTPTLRG